AYDAQAMRQFWRSLADADRVLKEFRGRFIGKCSPVHFFWGGFDLAVSRFNGRRTDAKADADRMNREAYSHEVISAGFWPGAPPAMEAAFYAYAVPEPPGYNTSRAGPPEAAYNSDMKLFILKYDDVRTSSSP